MPTIGQKLGETRREKGLTVNDVAHATRIHPNMLLNIEEDDFSKFPSVAYAKSFIRKYSEHLELDLSAAMDHLNSGVTLRLEDSELINESQNTFTKDRLFRVGRRPRNVRRRIEKPGGAPLFLNFILLALISALGIFYFLGYNADSIEEAKSDIAAGLKLPYPSESVGDAAPSLPGSAPQDPVRKPPVSVPFDEPLPTAVVEAAPDEIPANPLRPRSTPQMVVSDELVASPQTGELPATEKPDDGPPAILRPAGTTPSADRASTPPASTIPETNGPVPEADPPGKRKRSPIPIAAPIRAVPVATSE